MLCGCVGANQEILHCLPISPSLHCLPISPSLPPSSLLNHSAALELIRDPTIIQIDHTRTSCLVPCRVKSSEALPFTPTVRWYKALDGSITDTSETFKRVDSNYWLSRHRFPSASCQSTEDGSYDCSLSLPYCTDSYTGRYKCVVTDPIDGTKLEQTVVINCKLLS